MTDRERIAELRAARDDLHLQFLAASAQPENPGLADARKEIRAVEVEIDELAAKLASAANGGPAFAALDAAVPLALLPVRLETRFAGHTLQVRIYPDDIVIDDHDRGATATEAALAGEFWDSTRGATPDEVHDAWRALADRVGPARAEWLRASFAPGVTPPPISGQRWSQPARASVLPDRFVVHALVGSTWISEQGSAVPDLVQVGLDPLGDGAVGANGLPVELDWMMDFAAATRIGLGIALDLPADTDHVEQLVVVGVAPSLDAEAGAARLSDLFRARRATDRLQVIPRGVATNDTGGIGAAPYDADAVWSALARSPSDGSDGSRLDRAFGLGAGPFASAVGADARDHEGSRNLADALWWTTWGDYLHEYAGPSLDPDDPEGAAFIESFRDHLLGFVRAGGPFAGFLAGEQPYGVLPVLRTAAWKPDPAPPAGVGEVPPSLTRFLLGIEQFWSSGSGLVPGGFPDLLTLQPHSLHIEVRNIYGRSLVGERPLIIGEDDDDPDVKELVSWALLAEAGLFDHPIGYAAQDKSAESTRVWLPMSSEADTALLAAPDQIAGSSPDSVLGILAKQAAIHSAAHPPPWGLSIMGYGAELFSYLVGITVEQAPAPPPPVEPLAPGLASSFRALAELPVADRARMLGEYLDSCSHRYDAWVTSIATRRLDQLRARRPAGISLGAWGYVEGLDRRDTEAGGSVRVVPSVHHAATAAVLGTAITAARADPHADAEAVDLDLSAPRVRRAHRLLDGMRAGVPLGLQLGQRFEAALQQSTAGHGALAQYVLPFRELLPSRSATTPPQNAPAAGEDPASSWQPVDGAALAAALRNPQHWATLLDDAKVTSPEDRAAIQAIARATVEQEVDAVHDVLTAEAVHQLVGGAFDRATAILQTLDAGEPPPEDLTFTQPPGPSTALEQRLVLALGPDERTAANWPPATAPRRSIRATLSPRLEAWASRELGDAALIRFATAAAPAKAVSLADLGVSALDFVFDTPADGLGPGLLAALRTALPSLTSGADVVAAPVALDALRQARAIRALIGRRRTLSPTDFSAPGTPTTAEPAPAGPELLARLDRVLADLGAAIHDEDPSASTLAWLRTTGIGFDPWTDDGAQAIAAARERLAAATQARAVDPMTAERAREAIALLVGDDLPCPAEFDVSSAASVADGDEVDDWLVDYSAVREQVALLAECDAHALARGIRGRARTLARQSGVPDGTAWICAPAPALAPTGPLSTWVVRATEDADAGGIAGLVLDEWTEEIPRRVASGALALRIDAPSSKAPNVMLLAVPAVPGEAWSGDAVVETVLEAIRLAKLRLVDLDAARRAPALLPAIHLNDDDLMGLFDIVANYSPRFGPTFGGIARVLDG